MKNKIIKVAPYVLVVAFAFLMLSNADKLKTPKLVVVQPPAPTPNNIELNIYPPQLPASLNFAGEQVPMNDQEVRERIDKELMITTYWHSNTLRLMKMSNRFFPIIEPILAQNGIPDDFKYLAVAESGLEPVTSPAGAKGYWQFLKGTAKEYGMEVNSEVDERYHIEKATRAACKYIKSAQEKFGSYTMAAASFNMGRTGLNNQISRQKQSNYYNLLLNNETSRYVPRILVYKEIFSNPGKYGFQLNGAEMYPQHSYREI